MPFEDGIGWLLPPEAPAPAPGTPAEVAAPALPFGLSLRTVPPQAPKTRTLPAAQSQRPIGERVFDTWPNSSMPRRSRIEKSWSASRSRQLFTTKNVRSESVGEHPQIRAQRCLRSRRTKRHGEKAAHP